MGEYAEMMLDGTCCEGCGEYLGGKAEGIPRYCSKACEPAGYRKRDPSTKREKNVPCPNCARSFSSEYALGMHRAAKHTWKVDPPNP